MQFLSRPAGPDVTQPDDEAFLLGPALPCCVCIVQITSRGGSLSAPSPGWTRGQRGKSKPAEDKPPEWMTHGGTCSSAGAATRLALPRLVWKRSSSYSSRARVCTRSSIPFFFWHSVPWFICMCVVRTSIRPGKRVRFRSRICTSFLFTAKPLSRPLPVTFHVLQGPGAGDHVVSPTLPKTGRRLGCAARSR